MDGHAEGRTAKAKPPKILTNNFWPVRENILSRLSYHDKRALVEAYPELKIQEDAKYKRQELLHQVEILSGYDSACNPLVRLYRSQDHHHSHFGHPLLRAIREKRLAGTGKELGSKTQEINHYISNISKDIHKIQIETELCLSVAPECGVRGYTALHVVTMCDDVETARSLIEQGADMYRLGGSLHFRFNSLHVAALAHSTSVVRFLCQEMSIDKARKTEDARSRTALEIAERVLGLGAENPIVQLLKS